jgi:hypothetical protein
LRKPRKDYEAKRNSLRFLSGGISNIEKPEALEAFTISKDFWEFEW